MEKTQYEKKTIKEKSEKKPSIKFCEKNKMCYNQNGGALF